MRRQVADPAVVEAEIERLRSCAVHALRRRWLLMFGRTPPAAFSKDMLARVIACRIQESAFGGLDRESLKFLDGLTLRVGLRPRQLKVGTVLVRDHHGQRHTVTVARGGYDWGGTTYSSLSAIARVITGTAWSGPRFFGLVRGPDDRRKRKSADQRALDQHGSIKTRSGGAQRITAANPVSPAPHVNV